MQNDQLLKNEERAVIALRALYQSYGYLPYKMSRFEEYELYARNKDFLLSDRVITFTDTNGRLMALKPDVTLSILQKGEENPGCKRKVCYNENVYRVSRRSGQFKEIMQTGLECIGDVDGCLRNVPGGWQVWSPSTAAGAPRCKSCGRSAATLPARRWPSWIS